jgi:hypothetical protein
LDYLGFFSEAGIAVAPADVPLARPYLHDTSFDFAPCAPSDLLPDIQQNSTVDSSSMSGRFARSFHSTGI